MPPSLREVAWRVPRKRHDGGSHLWKGEDSLSLAMLDSSLREGAEMPPSLREVARRVPRKRRDGGSSRLPRPAVGAAILSRPTWFTLCATTWFTLYGSLTLRKMIWKEGVARLENHFSRRGSLISRRGSPSIK